MPIQSQDIQSAHERFQEFVKAFYRDAGWEEPIFEPDADAHAPTAFEADVGGVKFSVGYDPLAGGQAHLFVYCALGVVPLSAGADVLRRLLEKNLTLARHHDATHCIDAQTHELACYMRKTLDVDVRALKAEMDQVAQQAREWRSSGLESRPRGDAAAADAGVLSAWNLFA